MPMKIELETVLTILIMMLIIVSYEVYDYKFDVLIDYIMR
jgi:hypothetical protein